MFFLLRLHPSLSWLLFAGLDYVFQEQQNKLTTTRTTLSPQDKVKNIADMYTDALYRYIRYTFSLDEESCYDMLQELFLQLPKKLTKYDTSKKFEPWLYRVTHNLCLDILRKKKNISDKEWAIFPEDDVLASFQYNDVPGHVEQLYKDSLLKVLLRKLSQKDRELIILTYLEWKSYEDIATIIWVKVWSVGTLLRRAKEALKTHIDMDEKLSCALTFDLLVQEE